MRLAVDQFIACVNIATTDVFILKFPLLLKHPFHLTHYHTFIVKFQYDKSFLVPTPPSQHPSHYCHAPYPSLSTPISLLPRPLPLPLNTHLTTATPLTPPSQHPSHYCHAPYPSLSTPIPLLPRPLPLPLNTHLTTATPLTPPSQHPSHYCHAPYPSLSTPIPLLPRPLPLPLNSTPLLPLPLLPLPLGILWFI